MTKHQNLAANSAVVRGRLESAIEGLERRMLLTTALPWLIGGSGGNDSIYLRVSADKPDQIEAVVNGASLGARSKANIRGIRIDGAAGNDYITVDVGPGFDKVVLLYGGDGNDTLYGSSAADRIDGGAGDDRLEGDIGNDTITGGLGNDVLIGDEGKDQMSGQDGNDTLAGGVDEDNLFGGPGADQIAGGFGADTISGDDGDDTLRGGDGRDLILGGMGRNTCYYEDGDLIRRRPGEIYQKEVTGDPLAPITDPDGLKQELTESAVQRWKDTFGQPAYWWRYGIYDMVGPGAAPPGSAPSADPSSHSDTNVQEQGVDEADLVETNGQYLYVVHDNELVVVDTWPAAEAHEVARVPLNGYVDGIYLTGNKLTVVSQVYEYSDDPWIGPPILGRPLAADFIGPPIRATSKVLITVLDVSDPTAPTVAEKTELDGSLSDSRMIGTRLYVVLNDNLDIFFPYVVTDATSGDQRFETEAEFRARIAAASLSELLPHYTTTAGSLVTTGSLIGNDFYSSTKSIDERSFFSVVLMDVGDDKPEPDTATSVVGFSGTIYASTHNLYVTRGGWDAGIGIWSGEVRTDIYKFGLGEKEITLDATGAVPGSIGNQFSMSEKGEMLRIATTTQQGGRSNNVFVLEDTNADKKLDVVGKLTGLAFNERIYSVRFIDDVAYVVTFRQIDPLFTIDLSDPTNPNVAGELKIPGFSTYLHPIGDGLLLGLGRNTDANGRTQGLQVSLFDVSDIHNPVRKAVYNITSDIVLPPGVERWPSWTSSGAEWDHHAFSYFPEQHILAVPVLDYGYWTGNARLELINVDAEAGTLSRFGQIQHKAEVLRSVQIDDFLFSIGRDAVRVAEFLQPVTELAVVLLDKPVVEPLP